MTPILLFLFALTLVFVGLAALGVLWAIKNGQFDDLEGPAQRILMDDDDPMIPFGILKSDIEQATMPTPTQEKESIVHIFSWENLPMTIIVALIVWSWISFLSVILA